LGRFCPQDFRSARLVANGEAKKATPQTKGLIRNATLFSCWTKKLPRSYRDPCKMNNLNLAKLKCGAVCALLLIRANWCAIQQYLIQVISFLITCDERSRMIGE